jgi:translation initiation factor RLI1
MNIFKLFSLSLPANRESQMSGILGKNSRGTAILTVMTWGFHGGVYEYGCPLGCSAV